MVVMAGAETSPGQDADTAKPVKIGRAVLRHLADDDIEKALGAIPTKVPSVTLGETEDQGLSVAAGAIHRQLSQLSTEEQYDLLYEFSMPRDDQQTVRMLTCLLYTSDAADE